MNDCNNCDDVDIEDDFVDVYIMMKIMATIMAMTMLRTMLMPHLDRRCVDYSLLLPQTHGYRVFCNYGFTG